jgi:hypothetical protein
VTGPVSTVYLLCVCVWGIWRADRLHARLLPLGWVPSWGGLMSDEPVQISDRRGGNPWARAIAATLTVNAMLVASLTWVAVARASAARDEDRRAVLQTVQTELVRVAAQVQARSERSNAAAYVAAQAQARAVAGLGATFAKEGDVVAANAYADEADTMVAAAEASAPVGFDRQYLQRGGFNAEGRQKALIRAQDMSALSTAVPGEVARGADGLHAEADRLAILVVLLVSVILLLTIARIVQGRARFRLLVAAWCLMAAVVVAAALIGG